MHTDVSLKSSRSTAERFNNLIKILGIKNYLEIGVSKGSTFLKVNAANKTGIDPAFRFEIEQYKTTPGVSLYSQTSDAFFHDRTEEAKRKGTQHVYDFVYIDGLHIFEQALKDFINSFPFTGFHTVWVFDDTVPSNPYSAIPDLAKARYYKSLAGVKGLSWHGDVFKCVLALHDFFPAFSYATVYSPLNPQTFVWMTGAPAMRKPVFGDMLSISRLNYFDMLDNLGLFNLIKEESLSSFISQRKKFTEPSPVNDPALVVNKL